MGDNSKASIITRGLAETTRLGPALGADADHLRRARRRGRPHRHLHVAAVAQPHVRPQPRPGAWRSRRSSRSPSRPPRASSRASSILELARNNGVDVPIIEQVVASPARRHGAARSWPRCCRAPQGRDLASGSQGRSGPRVEGAATRGRSRGPRRPRCRPTAASGSRAPWPARSGSGGALELALDPAQAGRVHPQPGAPRRPARRPPRPPATSIDDDAAERPGAAPAPRPGARRSRAASSSGVGLRPAPPAGPGCAGRAGRARPPSARRWRRAAAVGAQPVAVGAAASVVGVTAAPRSTSLCPERYFVTECTTTSAPSSSGRCTSGVAKVLSTTREHAALAGGGEQRRQVGHLEQRVGRRLQPDQVGAVEGGQRRRRCRRRRPGAPSTDPRPRGRRAWRRGVVGRRRGRPRSPPSGTQGEGGRDRGHPGGQRERVAALEVAERRLEGRPGRVARAGVDHVAARVVGRGEHQRGADLAAGDDVVAAERHDAGGGGEPVGRRLLRGLRHAASA